MGFLIGSRLLGVLGASFRFCCQLQPGQKAKYIVEVPGFGVIRKLAPFIANEKGGGCCIGFLFPCW